MHQQACVKRVILSWFGDTCIALLVVSLWLIALSEYRVLLLTAIWVIPNSIKSQVWLIYWRNYRKSLTWCRLVDDKILSRWFQLWYTWRFSLNQAWNPYLYLTDLFSNLTVDIRSISTFLSFSPIFKLLCLLKNQTMISHQQIFNIEFSLSGGRNGNFLACIL